jgi:hypothetical protein
MIISDLSYSTVVDANVIGSGFAYYKPRYVNIAYASAGADAFGPNGFTKTITSTLTVYGAYSGSASLSVSKSY